LHSCAKHRVVKHEFTRDHAHKGIVDLQFVPKIIIFLIFFTIRY